MNKKTIDKICWWIPIRKVKNLVKKYLCIDLYKKKYLKNNGERFYIVTMSGGLNDQIRWYFYGKKIEKKYNAKVKHHISYQYKVLKNLEGKAKREFVILEAFPDLDIEMATDEEMEVVKAIYCLFNARGYNTDVLKNEKVACLQEFPSDIGHCECADKIYANEKFNPDKYLLPKLKNESKVFYDKIVNTKLSVAMHIRRGDYLSMGGTAPDEYYFLNALKMLKNRLQCNDIKVFIFSDDVEWVKEKLLSLISNECDFEIVDGHDDRGYIDMYLMSLCHHQIISIGGFGWLAHQFNRNENKILITTKDV